MPRAIEPVTVALPALRPIDDVHHVRLEVAKQMLERGADPVGEIAVDIGARQMAGQGG